MPEKQIKAIMRWCDKHQRYSYKDIIRNPFWKRDFEKNFLDGLLINEFLDDQRVHPILDPEDVMEMLHKKYPEGNNAWWKDTHQDTIEKMYLWIRKNPFAHFSDLIRYSIATEPEWLYILCTDERQQFWFAMRQNDTTPLKKS